MRKRAESDDIVRQGFEDACRRDVIVIGLRDQPQTVATESGRNTESRRTRCGAYTGFGQNISVFVIPNRSGQIVLPFPQRIARRRILRSGCILFLLFFLIFFSAPVLGSFYTRIDAQGLLYLDKLTDEDNGEIIICPLKLVLGEIGFAISLIPVIQGRLPFIALFREGRRFFLPRAVVRSCGRVRQRFLGRWRHDRRRGNRPALKRLPDGCHFAGVIVSVVGPHDIRGSKDVHEPRLLER